MMLAAISIGLWTLLLAGRGTPTGAWLERWLVVKPAARLSRIHRQTVLAVAALAIIAVSCWWLIGHEGLLVFGFGLPELTPMLAAVDLGVFFDIAVLLVATASTGAWRAVRPALARVRMASRARRSRRVRTPRKPAANDDDDGPALAIAA